MEDLLIILIVMSFYGFFGVVDRWIFFTIGKIQLNVFSLIGINFLTFCIETLFIFLTLDKVTFGGHYLYHFYILAYFVASVILRLLIQRRLPLITILISSIVMTCLFFGAYILILEFKIFEKILA